MADAEDREKPRSSPRRRNAYAPSDKQLPDDDSCRSTSLANRLSAQFEELKKQQKGKKGGTKKKKEKADAAEADASIIDKPDETLDEPKAADNDATETTESPAEEKETEEPEKPAESARRVHGRQPSISIQSKLRSDSFRRTSSAANTSSPTAALKSPSLPPLSPGDDVQDIYRKQVQRIEELERENKRLQVESHEAEARWKKTEEELEELREASSEVAELKSKADQAETKSGEVDKLRTEVASLQRQNAHLQTQSAKARRMSTASPSSDDIAAQLASKSSTIESLELEISNLHSQLSQASTAGTSQTDKISALEDKLTKAEQAAQSSAQELSDLKKNLERASEDAAKEGDSRSSAETRIAQLEAELAAAQRAAGDAAKRAETLEKKVETLTTLHRESDARSQSRLRDIEKVEREAKELRSRITALSNENARLNEASDRHRKTHAEGDDAGLDELEDEERKRLMARIHKLEDENTDLRRGIWRDHRTAMQPGIEDHDHPAGGFDDVDLSGAHSPRRASRAAGQPRSSLQDVINSGISAFTGGVRRGSSNARQRPRKQSLGLISDEDDFAFDEDAFRAAQGEEARKRVERIKEVKRGLENWRGWRVDIVDMRVGMGGVLDV